MKNVPSSSPSFSPPSRTRTKLSWIGNMALVGFFLLISHDFVFYCFVFFYLFHFPFIPLCSPSHISFFKEVPSLHVDSFNAILLRLSWILTFSSPSSFPCMRLSKNTLLSMLPHNEGWFLLLLSRRWRSAILICCVRKFILGF